MTPDTEDREGNLGGLADSTSPKAPRSQVTTRIIKFRAWKPHNSLSMKSGMYQVSGIDWYDEPFQGNTGEVFYRGYKTSDYLEDIKLMQYTGLHDKNGRDIYEGDILAYQPAEEIGEPVDERYLVEWLAYGFGARWINPRATVTSDPVLTLQGADQDLAIIGNIYENPELLTKGNDMVKLDLEAE